MLKISGGVIVSIAILMMVINIIFDTSFFGLSLNIDHNIYDFVILESSFLSALVYFSGLILVLIIGYLFQILLNKYIRI